VSAAELLIRKADEWKALGEELTDAETPPRSFYMAIEVCLREIAEALDEDDE
jgi:hypothetical protein